MTQPEDAAQPASPEASSEYGAEAAHFLAAIVASSDDAILSKDLNGIITSWNQGAQRLFGYRAEEVVGRFVTILIPAERHNEEPEILSRIRRGERIEHYETVRQRKDGSLVDISLAVSPVRNTAGRIVGASKIARDITERRRAQERQELLLREMNHRVKNLFALAAGVVTLSARTADTPAALAAAVRDRLGALARAHDLTLRRTADQAPDGGQATTLHALIRTIVSPYERGADEGATDGEAGEARVSIEGLDAAVAGNAVTSLALLLHEFATNAAKYGALSAPGGRVAVSCADHGDRFELTWTERGGPPVAPAATEGFGTTLGRATARGQLGGEIVRDWRPEGLVVRLTIAKDRLAA